MSGVVFTAGAERPVRKHRGATYYFCCEGCARYFDEHAARITAARAPAH